MAGSSAVSLVDSIDLPINPTDEEISTAVDSVCMDSTLRGPANKRVIGNNFGPHLFQYLNKVQTDLNDNAAKIDRLDKDSAAKFERQCPNLCRLFNTHATLQFETQTLPDRFHHLFNRLLQAYRESGTIPAIEAKIRKPEFKNILDELEQIVNQTIASLGYYP